MKKSRFILIVLMTVVLAGCDQTRQSLADYLNPPSPGEMAARVEKLAKEGKSIEAIQAGETFLVSTPDPDGKLHLVLANLYLEIGASAKALAHLEKANGNPSVVATSNTNIVNAEIPAPQAAKPGIHTTTIADDATATIGPNGIEVRAGDAIARIQK